MVDAATGTQCYRLAPGHTLIQTNTHVARTAAGRFPVVRRLAVLDRLAGRPPANRGRTPLDLQPGAGGVLLVMDVLRRRRPSLFVRHGFFRDLHRADTDVRVRPAAAAAAGGGDQAQQPDFDRRFLRRALRQQSTTRQSGGGHAHLCRVAVPGAATPGDQPGDPDHRRRRHGCRPRRATGGHPADRLHHAVRDAAPHQPGKSSWPAARDRLRIHRQAGGLRHGLRICGVHRIRRRHPRGHPAFRTDPDAVGRVRRSAELRGSVRPVGLGDHLPAAPVPRHVCGEHQSQRTASRTYGVPDLPRPVHGPGAADQSGRTAGLRQHRTITRHLRVGAAAGAGRAGHHRAGLHRRYIGGVGNGRDDRAGAVDHAVQRSTDAAGAAHALDSSGRAGAAGTRAVDPPAVHHRPAAGRARGARRIDRGGAAGRYRPTGLRRRRAARTRADRRAVLDTWKPPRHPCRPARRLRIVGGLSAAAVHWPPGTPGRLLPRRAGGLGLQCAALRCGFGTDLTDPA